MILSGCLHVTLVHRDQIVPIHRGVSSTSNLEGPVGTGLLREAGKLLSGVLKYAVFDIKLTYTH